MKAEGRPIVCDLGTGYMKMGFSGDNFPTKTFASIIGRPMLRSEEIIEDVQLKPIMIGDEVTKYRSILELSYPTTEGIVKNWEDMELLLDYSFKSLGQTSMKDKSLMMTQAVMNPVANRVKMAQIMFQKFQVGRFQLGLQALMSLFAEALDTALLLDSGDGVTHCIPVYHNYVLMNQIGRLNIAGRHITNHFTKLLHMQGYAFNSTADFELVRELKEKYCFVSGDFKVDEKLAKQTTHHLKTHTLPDGNTVVVGKQRFLAPQLLFNPMLGGFQYDNCSEMVFKCINDCDISTRKQFYRSILISGGTTMFPGFPTRLRNEVEKLYKQRILKNSSSKGAEINVIDPPSRKYNVFIGAAFVAKITNELDKSWISKEDYQEKGARVIEQLTYNVR